MKIKDLARVERPREKLAKYGPGKLTTTELLAIILRTGLKNVNVLELAARILKTYSAATLATLEYAELKKITGLGQTKACEIIAALELGRRLLKDKPATLLLSPEDVWRELKDIRNHKKEHFIVFYLDSRSQEIKREIISVGTLNSSLVHPREVFEPAVVASAAQLILAHNHPSGNSEPSVEDTALTRRLCAAGQILGIEILDHVIVTERGHSSLRQLGIM